MSTQAAAGWYPDGQGNERYWDGSGWTDQIRRPVVNDPTPTTPEVKREGALGRLGSAIKGAAAEKKAEKEAARQQQADAARAAGKMATSGVFGTSTIEIYDGGYVRVAAAKDNATHPASIDKNTPFERLHSIKFTPPEQDKSGDARGGSESSIGPAMAGLLKSGKSLMKASPAGLAGAGIAHVAKSMTGKSYLTITTDRQIHTLTNQSTNSVGLKMSNKGHNEVALALEAAGNRVLGVRVSNDPEPEVVVAEATPQALTTEPAADRTLSDRLRELAQLHADGILSDEEFATAKARLIAGL